MYIHISYLKHSIHNSSNFSFPEKKNQLMGWNRTLVSFSRIISARSFPHLVPPIWVSCQPPVRILDPFSPAVPRGFRLRVLGVLISKEEGEGSLISVLWRDDYPQCLAAHLCGRSSFPFHKDLGWGHWSRFPTSFIRPSLGSLALQ